MLPAQNSGVGGNVGFPDTCNTPIGTGTSPITYPNYSTDATSVPSAINTMVGFLPALHQMSKASMTNGMQAGVAHALYMGMGGYSAGNVKIFMKGMPAESLGMAANGNNYNCSSDASLIPSITVTLFCRKPDHAERAIATSQPRPVVNWNRALAEGDLDSLLQDRPAVSATRVGDTAVVRVPVFHDDTPRQIALGVEALGDGIHTVEIDLRDNPGGSLDAAMRAADLFLPAGTQMVTQSDSDTPDLPARVLRARDGVRIACPLTLHVNARTASAAEAFAAALVDNDRATLYGETTFGKGAVQTITRGHWVTVGEVARIDGRAISSVGITV